MSIGPRPQHLDDVQWADPATADVIALLLHRPPEGAALLALAARARRAPSARDAPASTAPSARSSTYQLCVTPHQGPGRARVRAGQAAPGDLPDRREGVGSRSEGVLRRRGRRRGRRGRQGRARWRRSASRAPVQGRGGARRRRRGGSGAGSPAMAITQPGSPRVGGTTTMLTLVGNGSGRLSVESVGNGFGSIESSNPPGGQRNLLYGELPGTAEACGSVDF